MRVDKKVHDKSIKEEIKSRVAGKVDIQLGKNGVTSGFLSEVKNRLEKQGVVKIRILRSFRKTSGSSVEQVANYLAEQTGSRIYEIRGFTLILIKERIEKR